jgi:adenylosuccinate lyase
VCKLLSEAEMRELVKPENYLGVAQAVVERVVSRASAQIGAKRG